jgi:hypothetical protein
VTSNGQPAGPSAAELYKSAPNVSVRTLEAGDDPIAILSAWARKDPR